VAAQIKKPLAARGGLPNDAGMISRPHHKRHRRFSERNQVQLITGFVLFVVLALLAAFLWWTNSPRLSSR